MIRLLGAVSSPIICLDLQILIEAIENVGRCQRSDHIKKAINYVKILLEKQAEPNARDEWGSGSAMHYAIWCGQLEVVKLLLDTGACNIEADTGTYLQHSDLLLSQLVQSLSLNSFTVTPGRTPFSQGKGCTVTRQSAAPLCPCSWTYSCSTCHVAAASVFWVPSMNVRVQASISGAMTSTYAPSTWLHTKLDQTS